ncbi:MAG: nucleotide exchange factor GrpE [Anaerolineales bacterium]|nr:nucleotide exchange factor GrpE [Anaerolineales bacterium]
MKKRNESIDPEDQELTEDVVDEQDSEDEAARAETESSEETAEQAIERLQAEAEEYLDGWQRARAEFANYKKRIEREREQSRERITGELITRYLGVMDDLERALSRSPENDACEEWVAGVELIYTKFRTILEAEGVETIEEEGLRFDPNIHEAISYEESEEHEEGSVIEVTQRGYKLADRVLRPAMVRVAK